MSDADNAIRILTEQAANCKDEYVKVILSHLQEMAQGMPDIFLQDDKTFKGCTEFIFLQLQFKALKNCIEEKSYIALPNGAGTNFNVETEELYELAENYYFLSAEDLKAIDHNDEFQTLLNQLSKECNEKKCGKPKTLKSNTVKKTSSGTQEMGLVNAKNNICENTQPESQADEQLTLFD